MLHTKGFIATPAVFIVMSFVMIIVAKRNVSQFIMYDSMLRSEVRRVLMETSQYYADWIQSSLNYGYIVYKLQGNDVLQQTDSFKQEFLSLQKVIECKYSFLHDSPQDLYKVEIICRTEQSLYGIEYVRILSFNKSDWGLGLVNEIKFFKKI